MRNSSRFISLCLLSVLFPAVCASQKPQRGPSTPEERARAVRVAQELQTDPLAENVQADREWVLKWMIEIPDIGVNVCSGILGELGEKETGYPGALLTTMLASEAAFIIQHPDQANESPEIYFAGVDGALNAYVAIRKQHPEYHVAKLDEFLAKRNEGKLKDAVSDATRVLKCP
jgi:hypothetical protein